jgi:ATP-dependent RNA helicase DeaD
MTAPVTDRVRFSDLGSELPPALLQALAARSYEVATPVQAAVMDPTARGRDLLVSSQTGSGKTIAFGAALATTLLEATASPARVAGAPRALVIVPTRELAIQVRDELGWLLATTGLRLGSFTGGTAVSGDLRALHRGVDVAIGTPGRLVDLMRRERLALGQLEIVVLDEADEMLDLGFREDLETLLGAAPVERRTLLLSATLPSEIRALARRFQRDALAIDPRHAVSGAGAGARPAAAAHDDITYVAHLIAGGDRLAAVVNLLRASPDARAIVFCTTREAVGALHRELVARGFAATAISGERAQTERDRALDQVRQGEARILVATNVAARGIHLPDVDLIVHADLPLNAESLTHRSGRTGRAGRKGTAVLIASLAERRKAERLLATAHVRVPWTAPPSAKEIASAARAQLIDGLLAAGTPAADGDTADADADGSVDDLLAPFRGKLSVEDLACRLLARELGRLPAGEKLQPVPLPSAGGERGFGRGPAERPGRHRTPGDFAREGVRFRVNLGGKDQADPRWLLPLICRRGGVTRREVGAIRIGPHETIFEIAGDAAADFALAAAETDPRAPHVRMERIDGPVAGATPDARPPHTKPYTAKPHDAKPHDAKPHDAKPHVAKPHDAKPHDAKPHVAKPHDAKPHVAKPHAAKPHAAKPHHVAKPHTSQPHGAKPHFAKPHTAKPHTAKPHAARTHAAPAPSGGPLGGDRPYKRPHAARPDRFQPKHPHPAGKRRA